MYRSSIFDVTVIENMRDVGIVSSGHYIYVDSSVGEWGDMSYLVSDVFQPSSRGHCLTFWYHMYGSHIGTLNVYINDRSEKNQYQTEI